MYLEVPRVGHDVLRNGVAQGEESSAKIRVRVQVARSRALMRSGKANAALIAAEVKQFCQVDDNEHNL